MVRRIREEIVDDGIDPMPRSERVVVERETTGTRVSLDPLTAIVAAVIAIAIVLLVIALVS